MAKRHAAMVLAAGLGVALWPGGVAAANGAVSMVTNGTTGSCANGYSYCFAPTSVSIPAGASVTWSNRSTAPHTVTSDSGAFDSGNTDIAPGGSYSHTFTTPGTYSYHCDLHPYMTGTVTVTGGATTTTTLTTTQPTTTSAHSTTTTTRTTATQASTTTTRVAVPVATAPPATTTSTAPTSAPVAQAPTSTSSAASTTSPAGAVAGADVGNTPAGSGGSGGSGGTIAAVIAVIAVVALGGGAWWQRRRSMG